MKTTEVSVRNSAIHSNNNFIKIGQKCVYWESRYTRIRFDHSGMFTEPIGLYEIFKFIYLTEDRRTDDSSDDDVFHFHFQMYQ